jgi:hypothetical protein
MSEENIIEQVSNITVLNDIKFKLNDPNVDSAMDVVIKLIETPNVEPAKVAPAIVRLQAIAADFAIKGKYYQCWGSGKDDANKKNMYFTLADSVDKLAAALKYYSR